MLFIIDMQNDYINKKGGESYIKDAENLVDGIIDRIKENQKK